MSFVEFLCVNDKIFKISRHVKINNYFCNVQTVAIPTESQIETKDFQRGFRVSSFFSIKKTKVLINILPH